MNDMEYFVKDFCGDMRRDSEIGGGVPAPERGSI